MREDEMKSFTVDPQQPVDVILNKIKAAMLAIHPLGGISLFIAGATEHAPIQELIVLRPRKGMCHMQPSRTGTMSAAIFVLDNINQLVILTM